MNIESEGCIEIVGCTPITPGVEDGKVCATCDGDGQLGDPAYGEAVIDCPDCEGKGGSDPDAVAVARKFSEAYRAALLDD